MKNKGFSMVELIIVIAIMAILAGALAPVLLKYINKSRLSSDITTGAAIASAIMDTVVDDTARDDAVRHDTCQAVNSMDKDAFKKAVFEHLSLNSTTDVIKGKSKRDADGNPIAVQEFYYTLDEAKNKVEVFYGVKDNPDYQVYPVTGKKLLK